MIATLSSKLDQTTNRVVILEGKFAHQELRREHTDAFTRNIRNNVLIHGLEDSKKESQTDLCSKVESFMLNKLFFRSGHHEQCVFDRNTPNWGF